MKKNTLILLILGFGIGALGFWTADFSEEKALSDSLYYIKAPLTFILSLGSGFIWKNKPMGNSLFITFGVILGMASRIFADIIQDSSSHNLFPIELMIGLVIVFPAALVGSYLAHGVFFLSGKK